MSIGFALGNLAFGPGIGIALGAATGAALEKKYNPDPIPLKAGEKRTRYRILVISLSLGVTLLIAALTVYSFLR